MQCQDAGGTASSLKTGGQVYGQAMTFVAEVRAAMTAAANEAREGSGAGESAPQMPPSRTLVEFHSDPHYGGDLHRADMAWARHAARMGLSAAEIRTAIMQARDLSKKGSLRRQREYVVRTADKAIRQSE